MRIAAGGSYVLLLALTTYGHAFTAASSCESLSSLALPNTAITLAEVVPAGAFTLSATGPHPAAIQPTACLLPCGSNAHSLVGL